MITARENILRVLRHKEPEWIPCVPLIDPYNIPSHLPPSISTDPLDKLAVIRFLKGDILDRFSGGWEEIRHGIESSSKRDGDTVVTNTVTPVGTLSSKSKRVSFDALDKGSVSDSRVQAVEPISLSYTSEYPIKGVEDYKILRCIYENTEYRLKRPAINEYLEKIGDDGALMLLGPGTPLMRLVLGYAGIERFSYDLCDHREEVEHTFEVMAEKYVELFTLCADSPAELIMTSDDPDTSLISPKLYETYGIPALRQCAEICHRRNKVLIIHHCGHTFKLLKMLRDAGIDAHECLCPPKTGDAPIKESRVIYGDKVVIIARIDPPVLVGGTPADVEQAVVGMLEEAVPGDNFMLTIVCGRAPLENIQKAIATMRKFSEYPLDALRSCPAEF